MVIREAAIHLEEKLRRLHVQLFKHAVHDRSRGSVTGIEHDLHLALELELLSDLVYVRSDGIQLFDASLPGLEICAGDQLVDFLDRFAVQRSGAAYGLKAVVLGRIVAAGDHDRAVGFEVNGRIVQNRSGHHADIQHRAAAASRPFKRASCSRVPLSRQSRAKADDAAAMADQVCRQAAAQDSTSRVQQLLVSDAANIVLAKDTRFEHMYFRITLEVSRAKQRFLSGKHFTACDDQAFEVVRIQIRSRNRACRSARSCR